MSISADGRSKGPPSAFTSPTFEKDVDIFVNEEYTAATISPSGRDVALAGKSGLLIIDLDDPYSTPRQIANRIPWEVADVQWSPFACRSEWVASTDNDKAIIYNLAMPHAPSKAPIQFRLKAHSRTITDINFSAHHPDVLATCAVDSYVYTWDLRAPQQSTSFLSPARHTPSMTFADFVAGATQVKWNRRNEYMIASAHDRNLKIWDTRKGARPLTTVVAHNTKIYGIDWHRSDPHKIMTCSLDKTIKMWDDVGINSDISQPSKSILSAHPVLRARHTPFPDGIMVMPQRGSASLNLYHCSTGSQDLPPGTIEPAHTFKAHDHESRLHEFLWRSRGSIEDGFDRREFQLVSWGTDHHLHLYKVPSELLKKVVGYEKGGPTVEEFTSTRKGAQYITYRDNPVNTPKSMRTESSASASSTQPRGTLSSLLQSITLNSPIPTAVPNIDNSRTTMTPGAVRNNRAPRVATHIMWMDGVKVGERRIGGNAQPSTPLQDQPREASHDLALEITQAGSKFRRVNFEEINVNMRYVIVSFTAPWGEIETTGDRKGERRLVFLRFRFDFPSAYPSFFEELDEDQDADDMKPNALRIDFQKTTAAIDEETVQQLKNDMHAISQAHADIGQESLEAVLSYALGERDLNDSLEVRHPNGPLPGISGPTNSDEPISDVQSSSEDEDSEPEANDLLNSTHSNVLVPLPVQVTIRFSASGSLVVAKIPSNPLNHPDGPAPLRLPRQLREGLTKDGIFESFGRLTTGNGDNSSNSSLGSWATSSSSSSSGSDNETETRIGAFAPPLAWQKSALRHQTKTSQPSSIGPAMPPRPKSVVSILAAAVEDYVPSKRVLAEEYWIFGDGPTVCSHNADVAQKHGFQDLADIWTLCKLILNNEIPLEILPQQHRREQILVLARRALVRIKRKDSGLDLQFDEADTVTNPKLKGRIKWGNHSVVTWLIPALFEHFERVADIQMLAMLSCIFSEPAAREGVANKMRQSGLPMSMEAPAFSLDYFSSTDAAWSLFKPTISIPSTPAYSRYATPVNDYGWQKFQKSMGTYGSHGSSNGPWGSDTVPSEPVTPYSTGNTPPNLSRAPTLRSMTTANTPYSTSPEQTHPANKKTSTGNFANAIATLSRPFANAISSSPPVKGRTDDLSTSAPTSGVTWGTTTFYSSGSNERTLAPARAKHGKRASFGQADRVNIDYMSDSDSDYNDTGPTVDGASEYTAPLTPREEDDDNSPKIRVTLKNQDQFDDEACVSAPLLDMSKEWLYRAWREQYAEMLACWGLVSKRAEVLKFNGLVSYFPSEGSRTGSKAGSMCLGLRRDDENDSRPDSHQLSKASTLAPPHITLGHFKRSPATSPRHFSFNPEAMEFTPGNALSPTDEVPAPPPDVFITSEQYLRLSITPPAKDEEHVLDSTEFDGVHGNRLHPGSRPNISRHTSTVSGGSIARKSIATKPGKNEPVYSCSICWIRVSGRFYLCPACGHVAHFDCMDDEIGTEEGECVVGCGCGCGFEDYDIKDKLIDEFRKWEENGGWMPGEFEEFEPATPFEGVYGEEIGRWSADVVKKSGEEKAPRKSAMKNTGRQNA